MGSVFIIFSVVRSMIVRLLSASLVTKANLSDDNGGASAAGAVLADNTIAVTTNENNAFFLISPSALRTVFLASIIALLYFKLLLPGFTGVLPALHKGHAADE